MIEGKTPVRADRTANWAVISAKLLEKVYSIDFTETHAWGDLDLLSSHTHFNGLNLDTASGVIVGDRYIVPGTVFVELSYGNENDGTSFHDAYPISVEFKYADGEIQLIEISTDTRSFYE